MKYTFFLWAVFLFVSVSCHSPEKQDLINDQASDTAVTEKLLKDNLVKSEAPDAVTKITQGYALPKFDDGIAQSPINILSDSAVSDSSQFKSIQFNAGLTAVENLGHTVQLDFSEGSTAVANGKTYLLKQFHFHTPSEHMIDGMTFPMEMHVVNILQDSTPGHDQQYLVMGLLFRMGRENKFIEEFLNQVPRHEEKDSLTSGMVKFEDLFNSIPKAETRGYYSYKGSLTTPPYSETVTWVVKKYILEASPAQINRIEKMEGDNARHVRALYARKVYKN